MSLRGRDYFIMGLAHELKMTRRQLLSSIDSYELTMWKVYFDVMNQPPQRKQSKEQIEGAIKNLVAAKVKGKKHA